MLANPIIGLRPSKNLNKFPQSSLSEEISWLESYIIITGEINNRISPNNKKPDMKGFTVFFHYIAVYN